MDSSPPGSSVHGDSPGQNIEVDSLSLLQGNLPNPGIEHRFPTLQADALPSEPPGKPHLSTTDPFIGAGHLYSEPSLFHL